MWYRLYAFTGPGHQSKREKFFWSETPLTEVLKKAAWDDWMDTEQFRDSAAGGVEEAEPSMAARQEMILEYQEQYKTAAKMLALLRS